MSEHAFLGDRLNQDGGPGAARRWLLISSVFALAVLTGMAAALGIVSFLHSHLGHDQASYVYLSREVLRGVNPYGSELLETNPPFILWFTMIPVLLAQALHLGVITGFRIFSIALLAAVTLWSLSLFRRLVGRRGLLLWWFAFSLVFVTFDLVHNEDFGQREHFLAVLLMPYLLLAAMRLSCAAVSRWEIAAIGFTAAVAVCLKPQQIVIVFLVEGLVLLWTRRATTLWNPAPLAFVTGVLIYVIAARLSYPAYFQQVIPFLREAFWGFRAPYAGLLASIAPLGIGLFGCVVMYALFRRFLELKALVPVLAVSALAGFLAFLQQQTDFYYHVLPAKCYTVLLAMILLGEMAAWLLREGSNAAVLETRWKLPMGGFVAAFALAAAAGAKWMPHPDFIEPEKQEVAEVLARYPADSVVGYISPAPYEWPTVLEQGKRYGLRYIHFWPLPAILISTDPSPDYAPKRFSPARARALTQLICEQTAADLRRSKPVVVFVDDCEFSRECAELRREDYANLTAWFQQNPAFRQEWSHYQIAERKRGLAVYTRLNDGK
jgi:hypothetical protein